MENSLSLQICRKEKSLLLLQHLFVSFSFPLPPVTDDSGLLVHCISGWDRTPLFISLLRLSLWAVSTCLTCSASGGGWSEGEQLRHQKVVLEHLMFLLLVLPSEGGVDWLQSGAQRAVLPSGTASQAAGARRLQLCSGDSLSCRLQRCSGFGASVL